MNNPTPDPSAAVRTSITARWSQMRDAGWSQRALAREAGMTQANLCDYLNGRAELSGPTLANLLSAMGWGGMRWGRVPVRESPSRH